MLLLLQKKLCSYLLPSFTPQNPTTLIIPSTHHFVSTLRHFSNSKTQNPSPKPHFMVEYLINSFGFSPDKAIKASKHLTHIKSPSNPDFVLLFLRECGLSETHIRKLISQYPRFLCSSVEKTLKPKVKALQEMGFSESEIVQLVSENPLALRLCHLQPKIEFWRGLLGTNENLLKAIGLDRFLLSSNLTTKFIPNISLLRECGIPDDRIAVAMLRGSRIISRSYNSIKDLIGHTEELGFARGSAMFWRGLICASHTTRALSNAKLSLLKSLGWSEDEVLSAIRKIPYLLLLSEKNIQSTMNFLVKEVGCEPSYVSLHPVLMCMSLEGRLIPRSYVLKLLKAKGLPNRCSLAAFMKMSDKKFVEKFILLHKEKVPELYEVYVAAYAGRVQI